MSQVLRQFGRYLLSVSGVPTLFQALEMLATLKRQQPRPCGALVQRFSLPSLLQSLPGGANSPGWSSLPGQVPSNAPPKYSQS